MANPNNNKPQQNLQPQASSNPPAPAESADDATKIARDALMGIVEAFKKLPEGFVPGRVLENWRLMALAPALAKVEDAIKALS